MRAISFILIFSILGTSFSAMATGTPEAEKYSLEELTFPSDVKDQSKAPGAIFYSPTVKNKVMIPVNIWGEVNRPGLHFIPVESSLIKGLTLAGGPTGSGKLENIKLIRKNGDKQEAIEFDMSKGGEPKTQDFTLKTGDVIFIEKDRFYENRAYYTGLIGIITTALSGFFIYQRIKDN